jgi:hypothetical protein
LVGMSVGATSFNPASCTCRVSLSRSSSRTCAPARYIEAGVPRERVADRPVAEAGRGQKEANGGPGIWVIVGASV